MDRSDSCGIEVRDLLKEYGRDRILENINLNIGAGEFITIIGASGCGKSTLLSILAGLIQATAGSVQVMGSSMMIFQQDGLLPWRTVRQNVSLGMEIRKASRQDIESRTLSAIRDVGLEGWENYFPGQISGGMRQRVAIARAVIMDPDILFMDEPFGALDAITRMKMQDDLLRLWQGTGKTIVMVTHDVDEAIKLSDRILTISGRPGKITLDTRVKPTRPRDPGDGSCRELRNRLLEQLHLKSQHWTPSI